jgi:hypothetical protein
VRLHNVQNQSIDLLGVMPTVSDTQLMTPPRAEQGKGLGWAGLGIGHLFLLLGCQSGW